MFYYPVKNIFKRNYIKLHEKMIKIDWFYSKIKFKEILKNKSLYALTYI